MAQDRPKWLLDLVWCKATSRHQNCIVIMSNGLLDAKVRNIVPCPEYLHSTMLAILAMRPQNLTLVQHSKIAQATSLA